MSEIVERDLTRITHGVVIVLLNARHPFRWGIGEKVANAWPAFATDVQTRINQTANCTHLLDQAVITNVTHDLTIVGIFAYAPPHPMRPLGLYQVANAEHMADIIDLVCKGTSRTVFMPYLCPTNPFYAPLFSRIEHLPICWCRL